jgi:aspartate racemase
MKRREVITFIGTAGFLGLTGFIPRTDDMTGNQESPSNDSETGIPQLSTMKTIGILGGLGPQATIDLEMRLHRAAQQLIPPMQNSGYPPIIVQYYRHPVLLTKEHQPVFPWQPDPRLLQVAKKLGPQVDFLLIPSNGVHLFQKEIEEAAGRKIVSMIDATLEEVKKRKWQKVGVLGFMTPRVYTNRLKELNIEFETIDDTLQEKLNRAIMRVMEGRENGEDQAIALQAIEDLRNKMVDGIIPGCTELPFLLGKQMEAGDVLNPSQLLAEAALKFALSNA